MLTTTYFGEAADVYLCMPDGRAIASSGENLYKNNLIDMLEADNVIDGNAASDSRGIFMHGEKAPLSADLRAGLTISV